MLLCQMRQVVHQVGVAAGGVTPTKNGQKVQRRGQWRDRSGRDPAQLNYDGRAGGDPRMTRSMCPHVLALDALA